MKIINELIPEIPVFHRLLSLYKKLTEKINKNKIKLCNTINPHTVRKRLLNINELNNTRATIAFNLLYILNDLCNNNKEALSELLNDILPEDIVNLIFFEENQLYTLTKSLDLVFKNKTGKGLNLNTDFKSNDYSFHLKEYIILGIINNYTFLSRDLNQFIKSEKDIADLKEGCMKMYPKYLSDIAFKNDQPEIFDDMHYDLNVLFSILEDDFKYDQNQPNENIQEIKMKSNAKIIVPPKGMFER